MDNYKYQMTVEVVIYNPDLNKLLYTLHSVLRQKGVKFEVIIADDGSKVHYDDIIKRVFDYYNFKDYQIINSSVNQGTVLNCLGALEAGSGKYARGISPGDFFYDDSMLANLYAFAEEHNSDVIFGVADCYSHREGYTLTKNRNYPRRLDIYQGSQRSQQIEYFICNDLPLGAAYCMRREVAVKYRRIIAGRIKFAEDYAIGLMLADGIRLNYYPEHMVWYESDSGISARGNSKWAVALKKDLDEMHKLLMERIEEANNPKLIKIQDRLYKASSIKNPILKYLTKTLIYPLYPLYMYRGRKITNPDKNNDIRPLLDIVNFDIQQWIK